MDRFRDPAWQGVGVALALILGLYGFGAILYDSGEHGWGITLFILGSVVAIVTLLIVLARPIEAIFKFVASVRIKFYREGNELPPKYQGLLDIAEAQCKAVQGHLFVMDQSIDLRYLDNPEPYFTVTYIIGNGSIYTITWENTCEGKTTINGKPLEKPLELLEGGGQSWLPDHHGRIRVRQYVSKESVGEIKGLVKGIVDCGMINNLLHVRPTLEVRPGCEGGVTVKYTPTAHQWKDFFVTPNR